MDRRGSGFKKILSDYRTQPNYTPEINPKFYSDNDSFLLILSNVNYQKAKPEVEHKRRVTTIDNMEKIIAYLKAHDGAKTRDIAGVIGLSAQRTRAILNEMDEVMATGEKSGRKYWLKK